MAKSDKNFSTDLLKVLTKSVKNKIYGSVEIFFEAGNITQITQRIIRKIQKPSPKTNSPIKEKKLKTQVEQTTTNSSTSL